MSDWQYSVPGRLDGRTLATRTVESLPLLRVWSIREFRTRYRQHAFDVLWSVITPVMLLLIYGFILTAAFDVSADGLPYLAFAWAGLAPWTYLSSVLLNSVPSISTAGDTISKVYFPREVIPLSVVGASLMDLAITTLILLGLTIVQGLGITWQVIALLPVLLVLVLWTSVFAMFGAAIGVFVRDLRQASALLVRVAFIATPIMYPPSLIPDSVRWTVVLNPVAVVAEGTRDVVLRHQWPNWGLLGAHMLIAGVGVIAAIAYTRSVEAQMTDVI